MDLNKKNMLSVVFASLIFPVSSCRIPKGPVEIVLPSNSTRTQQEHDSAGIEKRFHQPGQQQGPTALESAIELSEKYAKLAEESAALQAENNDLIKEKRRLKNQLAALEAKLEQTQQELTDANRLMIEMRIELNNWKTDIIGFRDEMRLAEKTQLDTLLKILEILGGKVKAESNLSQNATSTAASPSEPDAQTAPGLGESNE